MNYDKASYLFWCIIVLMLILGTSVLSNYGKSFLNDPNFKMFFSWYVALVLLNLFTILVNLIYHYFMKDLVGPRGLKGEIGDRGPPGKDDKCGCTAVRSVDTALGDGYDIAVADDLEAVSFTAINGATTITKSDSTTLLKGTGSAIVKATS